MKPTVIQQYFYEFLNIFVTKCCRSKMTLFYAKYFQNVGVSVMVNEAVPNGKYGDVVV